jgi:8-oxo-dGTP diphosphatase
MVNSPFDFCPYCGAKLEGVDEPTVQWCESCEQCVFYNPTPSARLAVLDGEAMLLVTRPDGRWITPGGKVEVRTDPDEHAAIELEEETSLVVDPDDLVLFDTGTYVVDEALHCTGIRFAVERADTSGTIEAGSDAGDAKFWTADELADYDGDAIDVTEFRERRRAARAALE